jgi:uncharacterized protein YuzE
MMTTSYDPEADALYVRFVPKGSTIAETRELEPGILLDVDGAAHLVGIEVLGVRSRSTLPAVPHAA